MRKIRIRRRNLLVTGDDDSAIGDNSANSSSNSVAGVFINRIVCTYNTVYDALVLVLV